MSEEIKNIVEAYNRLDAAFMFMPTISFTDIETAAVKTRSIKVEVSVTYNTNNDSTPYGSNWSENA